VLQLQLSFMYLHVQNASRPTPSVAVAFKFRQELKLVFSSNPKENWIQWPNVQLHPHVSCVCLVCIDWMPPAAMMQTLTESRVGLPASCSPKPCACVLAVCCCVVYLVRPCRVTWSLNISVMWLPICVILCHFQGRFIFIILEWQR